MYGFPDRPWWTPDAVSRVEQILTPESRVLEFGSGGSTVWLAERAGHVISVDDNAKWQDRIRPQCPGVDLRLLPRPYASVCETLDPESLDVVIVDGRDRVACFVLAMALVKPGGWIVLDDASRNRYSLAWKLVQDWRKTETRNRDPKESKSGSRVTWLWQRPGGPDV